MALVERRVEKQASTGAASPGAEAPGYLRRGALADPGTIRRLSGVAHAKGLVPWMCPETSTSAPGTNAACP